MAQPALLDAAARAFALVACSDGNLSLLEESRFAKFVASDPALKGASADAANAAWARAIQTVQVEDSFGPSLLAVRTAVASAADKEAVMRAAQAALVADAKLELQENEAIQMLAEALGLDPGKY